MPNELEDILVLADACLKCNRLDLVSGRRPLTLRSEQFQYLSSVFKGQDEAGFHRLVFTEAQQKQLDSLHELLERCITSLVISQRNVDSIENLVLDLNLVKRIQFLQLDRVPLKKLRGLTHLKTQLKSLAIDRCKELNVICVAGKLEWVELTELRIRRCGFPKDNECLFYGMPWLNRLALNFCEFETCDFLSHLPSLRHLDLSFNRISGVPQFHEDASKHLKTLILHHNYLTDLKGIETLTQLDKLDLSWNWLSDKDNLASLLSLKCLTCLEAANNPISFMNFYRIYVALALGTTCAQKFKLDGKLLSDDEIIVIGSLWTLKTNQPCSSSSAVPSDSSVKKPLVVSKIKPNSSRVRQVVIEESPPSTPQDKVAKESPEMIEVVETPPKTELLPDAENLVNSLLTPDHFPQNESLVSSTPKLSLVCTEAQVHAIDNQNAVGETNASVSQVQEWASDHDEYHSPVNSDDQVNETFDELVDHNSTWYKSCETTHENLVENKTSDCESSAYGSNDDVLESDDSSEPDDDAVLWLVERYNEEKTSREPVFLSIFNNSLFEISTKSNKTLNKWLLTDIETCSKTSVDPVTIEIRFNTSRKDWQLRCYVMEFSDAQILLKNVYEAIEDYKLCRCSECSSVTAQDGRVCTVCNCAQESDAKDESAGTDKSVKLSQKPSSGVDSSEGDSGSTAASSSTESCSATSSEQSSKNDTLTTGCHAKHYESDVEVISSLSQSSVEVLDDESSTPERKISQEERKVFLAPPLSTVHEVISPLSALTESSSSGSLTESVVTTYEPANNAINKKSNVNVCLLEECEISSVINSRPQDAAEENNGNDLNGKTEIYSYSNFVDVDHRIKLFLLQSVFQDDNEELNAFIRCHIWKTGGIDYDGCFALSNRTVYFFQHSFADFNVCSEASELLSLVDSYNLDSLKMISRLPWNSGLELKINNISFLLLIMDQSRVDNFEDHLRSLNLQCKIMTSLTLKMNALQSTVIQNSARNTHSVRDPGIVFFTLSLTLSIIKDDFSEESMRLAGVIVASSEFFIIPGNLSWLCSDTAPIISAAKDFSSLIEVEKREHILILHFLDEAEAVEEIWSIKLPTTGQVERMIDSIKGPWEAMFSAPLEIKEDSP